MDAVAVRLRRVQVFHSGAASQFNLNIETSTPNSGSTFDPRNVAIQYSQIPGSVDYTSGLDQVEDIIALTDNSPTNAGNLYLKFMPFDSGNNDFKYLLFFEAVVLYEDWTNEHRYR